MADTPKGKTESPILPLILTFKPVVSGAALSIFDLYELISKDKIAMSATMAINAIPPPAIARIFIRFALVAFTL